MLSETLEEKIRVEVTKYQEEIELLRNSFSERTVEYESIHATLKQQLDIKQEINQQRVREGLVHQKNNLTTSVPRPKKSTRVEPRKSFRRN